MTHPRLILPGECVMTTARTVARFYLFRPDPELVSAVKYCLAHYAHKHGVAVLEACLMSTHLHLVLYDETGHRSDFLRDVHRGIANIVKAYRGWRGPVFSSRPNIVRLLTPGAIVDKIAYLRANPVAAGAVRRAKHWPGLCIGSLTPEGRSEKVMRPSWFFSAKGGMPERAELRVLLPPMLVKHFGRAGAVRAIANATSARERAARSAVVGRGRPFSGIRKCLSISPFRRAKEHESPGEREPTFSTKGAGHGAFLKAARELRAFRQAYRLALADWRRGIRDTPFPKGTWLMRVLHGVSCEDVLAPG